MTETTETNKQNPAKSTNSIRLPVMNDVKLAGRLVKDATIRSYGENQKVANFTMAVNARVQNSKSEWIDKTSYINVAAFGAVAKYSEGRLTKGSPVVIEGRLSQNLYEKDGRSVSDVKIEARKIQFLARSASKGAEAGREAE